MGPGDLLDLQQVPGLVNEEQAFRPGLWDPRAWTPQTLCRAGLLSVS